MSATAGEVALVDSAHAPTPAPSNSLAVIRANAGNSCQDTGNNSTDFAALAPH